MFDKVEKTTLHIEGMSCAHCQKRAEEALKGVKGVKSAQVSLEDKSAEVSFIPAKTSRDELIKAVEAAGYTAQ